MPLFGVTINVEDLYYEIEADNQEEAIEDAFDRAHQETHFYFDCNECIDLEEEDE